MYWMQAKALLTFTTPPFFTFTSIFYTLIIVILQKRETQAYYLILAFLYIRPLETNVWMVLFD